MTKNATGGAKKAARKTRRKTTVRTVQAGSVTVKIYEGRNRGKPCFTVIWYIGEKRERKGFFDLREAKKFARDQAEKLAAGQVTSPTVTIAQAQETAIPSSISARGEQEVLVTFQNRYKGTNDDEAITKLLGEAASQYFRQSFELKISGDEIPESEAETLIGELQELFARHNASAALTAKVIIKPTKEFHTARHTAFAPEQNLAIDKLVPVVAMVKTKLGKGE